MITALLLIAFSFFVFAQAAVLRSAGQSAADAAALAAARESRDQLYDDFLDAIGGDEDAQDQLDDILAGEDFLVPSACADAAPLLAARNDAEVTACAGDEELLGYTVSVMTLKSMGDSVLPSTEDQRAETTATAVMRALCEVTEADEERIELSCEDRDWSFDPADEDELPEARALFQVYLED